MGKQFSISATLKTLTKIVWSGIGVYFILAVPVTGLGLALLWLIEKL